jgi:hypothetical protein
LERPCGTGHLALNCGETSGWDTDLETIRSEPILRTVEGEGMVQTDIKEKGEQRAKRRSFPGRGESGVDGKEVRQE